MGERATSAVVSFHEGARPLCVARLKDALNPTTHLFDRQLRDKRWDATVGTEDLTSTAICLIGIHRAGLEPTTVGLEVKSTLAAMAASARRHRYAGGLGLVLWANAVWNGPPFPELLESTGFAGIASNDLLRSLTTMETAWLTSGLLHELRRGDDPQARAMLAGVRTELAARYQRATRVFSHAAEAAPIGDRVRKWVANFADQIYSVQASSFLALSEHDSSALEIATGCAQNLVDLQGELGQWWWHYDPRDGKVAQAFPVYSVHQHAMAPMALMSLAAAGGTDHRARVELSQSWLSNNELGFALNDREAGTIWRDIELDEGEFSRAVRHARSVVGWKPEGGDASARNLKVNYETRPYEWAWCLFAGAIASGTQRDEHVV